ncbi:hypothetical protein [Nocardioides sp. 1609]|uniref:hypothetical protein n=1 Tax=Nocardioides sp. 1609 TaxID=2508327 RepID=UPI00106F32C7|nr:hypothetical protein [Nocardioides sp. 1609]
MTPLHLGALHPVEQALTLVLAFGPFVVLAIVVWLRRRSDARTDPTEVDPTEVDPTEVEPRTDPRTEQAQRDR